MALEQLVSDANVTDNGTIAVANATRDENLAKLEVATLAFIFFFIVFGNSCVLVALAVRRIKMTRMYYFLLHLCISDLITAFFNVLPQMAWDITGRFYGGNVLCKMVTYFQLLGPYLSSYVLVVTAVDRYQAICFPLANCSWTPRRSKLMVAVAWYISLLCCIPQPINFSYQIVPDTNDEYNCWATFVGDWGQKAYVTWYAISVFFIPLVILIFTYSCICRTIWQNLRLKRKSCKREVLERPDKRRFYDKPSGSHRPVLLVVGKPYRFRAKERNVAVCLENASVSKDKFVSPRSHSIRGLSRAKIKTVKITVVVIACYIVCSTPFIIVQLWASWHPNASATAFWTSPTITILMLLSSLNSCVNPWIYLTFNQNLLNGLRQFCGCRFIPLCGQGEEPSNDEDNDNNQTVSQSSQTEEETCSSYAMTTRNGIYLNGRQRASSSSRSRMNTKQGPAGNRDETAVNLPPHSLESLPLQDVGDQSHLLVAQSATTPAPHKLTFTEPLTSSVSDERNE